MGSASQPMLVVKANRALLRKRPSFKDIRGAYEGYINETQLKFKELTPFEQKKIRDKIIEKAKRDRIKEIQVYLLSFFIVCLVVIGVYFLFTS
ncbi:hypothetical protein J0X14_02630 [Muricauda sp. CAU 1633]|uniref:hypothetical protein n=1 Tax=Allomuricauda sp. CAU 1633 TaxID=2816036 RepID=UPI001A8E7EF3|nr:hypothetical protein [Muricauda sp. CAU 1633]MBO0321176.1 hypothetical protein [Muricauda sp. CAU 1633]